MMRGRELEAILKPSSLSRDPSVFAGSPIVGDTQISV
jgi:hypothetical protein